MKNILNICITAFVVFAFISSSYAQNSQKEMDKKTEENTGWIEKLKNQIAELNKLIKEKIN